MNITTISPKLIFFLDASGALLSAVMLLIISLLQSFFTVPETMFQQLIYIPLVFASYSFVCAFINPLQWKRWLSIIAVGNILYALYSLALAYKHSNELTALGIIYFIAEALIIFSLVYLEITLIRKKKA